MALNQYAHQNFVTQHYLYAESKPSRSWTCVYGGEAQLQHPSTWHGASCIVWESFWLKLINLICPVLLKNIHVPRDLQTGHV